ncbi:MAG: rhodanese-like domain-containing protein [Sandaracinaceae bacterium]
MIERIPPHEAKRRLDEEGYVYVDVRSVAEFERGHPAGAYNIPLLHQTTEGLQPNPDFLSVVEHHFDHASKLILGCRSGGRSLRAAEMLAGVGYGAIADQRAGFAGSREESGWATAGLPTARHPAPGRSYEELVAGAEAKGAR